MRTLMTDAFSDFDRMVDAFLQPRYVETKNFRPTCDVSETKDHYVVSFDLPGVRKQDINIETEGRQLTVSGERRQEFKSEGEETPLRYERAYGKFQRTFVLPDSVDTQKIEAHYEDGVLTLALPKEEATKARKIEIQAGEGGGFLSKFLGHKKEEKDVSNKAS